ncbi:ABC transporter ATP-binding protein [Pseudoxanthomonas sp. F37]|uniref:ABC transporter ATP-binding protein n=1 Tax=Pseudoxanthomonas TaxID=83618 RepID=UPI001FD39D10|nr:MULTISPECIES: ABC transporter ATP-binding protein [Pseudoxanthomonas]UOV06587.1 ABC transporter ATP-binding protein [Pseudoxanthomonas mexicana]UOV08194.1 ABC transporter ATP-binding protein [Pseudoxanthomonas sp. F37]
MSRELVTARGLGKAFREYRSELLRFATWFGIPARASSEHWVLRGVSFSLGPGEAIGIVGQNGAGKSTLLKLITGTLRPSEGSVVVQGRVAAILELGMGFNPELTGRQNVFHSAGLMGMSTAEIEQGMPGIEEFAEIGEYFDQPVRTYSSGMQMRVAFSVATAFKPDLLIVDEALSVGDAYFQHKCFDRIRQYQERGTSLLIVSHDRGAVQSLCTRALLLERGVLIKDGAPEEVMDFYNALIAERENSTVRTGRSVDGRVQTISGTGEAVVEDIELRDREGLPLEFVSVGAEVSLNIRVRVLRDIERLVLGYMVKDRLGQVVFGTNTYHTDQIMENVKAGDVVDYAIAFPMNLGPGSYSISTALVSSDTHLVDNYEWRDLALVFNVQNLGLPFFIGSSYMNPSIKVARQ